MLQKASGDKLEKYAMLAREVKVGRDMPVGIIPIIVSPLGAVWGHFFKKIKYNDIIHECTIIDSPFGHIEQTVNSLDRLNTRN
jgi:hypothetical protein